MKIQTQNQRIRIKLIELFQLQNLFFDSESDSAKAIIRNTFAMKAIELLEQIEDNDDLSGKIIDYTLEVLGVEN